MNKENNLQVKIGDLFKDQENFILEIKDVENNKFLVDRCIIEYDKLKLVDSKYLELDDLIPLSINEETLKLIGFLDEYYRDEPILRNRDIYFKKAKLNKKVQFASIIDKDDLIPVVDFNLLKDYMQN